MYEHDTITAIATPPGQGGVAIIRLSGPAAEGIARKIFFPRRQTDVLRSHHLYLGAIVDPQNGKFLDEGLVAIMRAPQSYTGENVVEVHCHGGGFLARYVLATVLKQGARLARPGEFTERAFLNGRLDLSQAEAVLDLIQAKNEQGLHLAWEQMSGHLSSVYNSLREKLLHLIAYVEAFIDFPEDDIPERAQEELARELKVLIDNVASLVATFARGKVYREGVGAAIVGKPNVGKSSLLNLLLGTDRAIVTAIPGTTRDILEETVVIGDIPLVLQDTAGLRQTDDEVERIGVSRARTSIMEADIVLAVFDASRPFDQDDEIVLTAIEEKQCIPILNKTDLPVIFSSVELENLLPSQTPIAFSAVTGEGMKTLEERVQTLILGTTLNDQQGENVVISRVRHRDQLLKTEHCLSSALSGLQTLLPIDLVAVDLRSALDHIGEITGHITSEDILDRIFQEFCIGK